MHTRSSLLIVMNLCVVVDYRLLVKLQVHANIRRQNRFITDPYQFWESLSEAPRGRFQVVVGNFREHVMHLVRTDAVQNVMNKAVMAVDGGELPTDEIPLAVCVPRSVDLVVMQESDDDTIAGKDEQRDEVVVEERERTERKVEQIEKVGHCGQA